MRQMLQMVYCTRIQGVGKKSTFLIELSVELSGITLKIHLKGVLFIQTPCTTIELWGKFIN